MGNVQISLLHPSTDDVDMPCYRLIALEDVNIQPPTEAVTPAKVVNFTGKDEWGIIEPADAKSFPGASCQSWVSANPGFKFNPLF